MTVRTKLYAGFASTAVLTVIVQVILLLNLQGVTQSFGDFDKKEITLLQLANDTRYYDAVLTDGVRAIIIDPENKAERQLYDQNLAALTDTLNQESAMVTDPEDIQLFKDLNQVNDKLAKLEEQLLANPT